MLDFILAVDDPLTWHTLNLERNPDHYSSLMRSLGPPAIAALQQTSFGARVYFNTRIPFRTSSRFYKYGVISTQSLLTDLRAWDTLYISGRLHKPVHTLINDASITTANSSNLHHATAAALLTLPAAFTEQAFYTAVAALSYAADPRFYFRAENPNKVNNLVIPNLSRFRALYKTPLASLSNALLYAPNTTTKWKQASSRQSLSSVISMLPLSIVGRMENIVGYKPGLSAVLKAKGMGEKEVVRAAADVLAGVGRGRIRSAVMKAVGMVVWGSSLRQSLKGVVTAGLGRSWTYAKEKLKKGWVNNCLWENAKR